MVSYPQVDPRLCVPVCQRLALKEGSQFLLTETQGTLRDRSPISRDGFEPLI